MTLQEFRVLEELKEQDYEFSRIDKIFPSKNKAIIQRGLYLGLRKSKSFFIFLEKVRKGESLADLANDDDFRQFLHALEELGVLRLHLDSSEVEVLQREFFSSNGFRHRIFTLFAGLTAYRTMKKIGIPFEVIFDVRKDRAKYFDAGLITHTKCLFFVAGSKERTVSLSVPFEIYYLRFPWEARRSSKGPRALNIFKLKRLIEKTYGGEHGKEHNFQSTG